ncbi:hypothetical protein A2Y27_00670 [candidate division CPR2 bacterium GWD1_39_7]|nr:MAG: hypothetical protein A2Y27_00670 [candidate division CPR2 bacterium GWD1_39_7]
MLEEKNNQILQLSKEIEKLKSNIKKQRYGLVWVDVPEAFEDDVENKIPILKEEKSLAIENNDDKPTHLLIEGDNYHALTCLNYTHKGKVDVIYIDPPYNTGNDGFRYKDKRILDKYPDGTDVPKDSPYRHSYWLSFMKKRIELAKTLLTSNGVMFISIGNDEIAQLKLLCDEIFGEKDSHNIIHWKKNQKPQNASNTISESAEYVLVYFNEKPIKLVRGMKGTRTDERGSFKPSPLFTFDDRKRRTQTVPKGTPIECKVWKKGKLQAVRNKLAYLNILDEPIIKNGILQNDVRVDGQWRKTDTNGEFQKVVEDNRLFVNSNGFPNEKSYRDEDSKNVNTNLWLNAGYNELGKQLLDEILGQDNVFPYPKPIELIKEILRSINKQDAIMLDFFAGSGTSGHALLDLNREDDGKRQFILVTDNENNIMSEVCYPRIRNVINGYDFSGKEKQVLFEKTLTLTDLKKADAILEEIDGITKENEESKRWDKISKSINDGLLKMVGEKNIEDKKGGLGNSVKFYRADFVGENNIMHSTDKDKLELAYNAGELLAIAENTLYEQKKNQYYQIFKDKDRFTAIYFREEMDEYDEFIEEVRGIRGKEISVYVFSWESDESIYELEDLKNVRIKTIPQPIVEIYKQIYNLI